MLTKVISISRIFLSMNQGHHVFPLVGVHYLFVLIKSEETGVIIYYKARQDKDYATSCLKVQAQMMVLLQITRMLIISKRDTNTSRLTFRLP